MPETLYQKLLRLLQQIVDDPDLGGKRTAATDAIGAAIGGAVGAYWTDTFEWWLAGSAVSGMGAGALDSWATGFRIWAVAHPPEGEGS